MRKVYEDASINTADLFSDEKLYCRNIKKNDENFAQC